ncbi:MAG TPA: hypothetical protein PK360_06850 [bacterium]|nr:hypothetical protein [bacterium]
MARIVDLPVTAGKTKHRYAERLQTSGERWVRQEKKLVDQAEFLEAMIQVLHDVKQQNIRERDYAMMEIVSEEIPRYFERLDEIQQRIMHLRQAYAESAERMAN